MATYAGGMAGGGGYAPVIVDPSPSVFVQYQGTPVDHEVIPQQPTPPWKGGMRVTDAPLGLIVVTDSKQG